mmetsp:Transcript_122458/g.261293  ORF Transcript_122458/g.261293 Transcript_122458/m.261293 type:complete len:221 (+) Transcript_122458:84-746(+)
MCKWAILQSMDAAGCSDNASTQGQRELHAPPRALQAGGGGGSQEAPSSPQRGGCRASPRGSAARQPLLRRGAAPSARQRVQELTSNTFRKPMRLPSPVQGRPQPVWSACLCWRCTPSSGVEPSRQRPLGQGRSMGPSPWPSCSLPATPPGQSTPRPASIAVARVAGNSLPWPAGLGVAASAPLEPGGKPSHADSVRMVPAPQLTHRCCSSEHAGQRVNST